MSTLLDEIIATRKAKAIEYEEYLKQIADLTKTVQEGKAEDTPEQLDTPGKRAIYNNLRMGEGQDAQAHEAVKPAGSYTDPGDPALDMALRIDEAVKRVRPDGWRGVQAREQVIKRALFDTLMDESEVERIFLIIKAQGEY